MFRSIPTSRLSVILMVAVSTPTTSRLAMAQVVHFQLEDYADLGNVNGAIRTTYEQLNLGKADLSASLDYVSTVLPYFSSAADLNLILISDEKAAVLTLYNSLDTMKRTANTTNLQKLAGSLSIIDTSKITSKLNALQSALMQLNNQTMEPIPTNMFAIYTAVAVSSKAREQVTQLWNDAVAGEASLLAAHTNADSWNQTLGQLYDQVQAADTVSWDLIRMFGAPPYINTVPLNILIIKPLLEQLASIDGDLVSLRGHISDTRDQINATEYRISQRLQELDKLTPILSQALLAPSLASSWTTSADVGSSNAFYNLSFSGQPFTYNYVEIDGPFLIGILSVTNYITPGQGDASYDADITFNVTRVVNDPDLGTMTTSASTSLSMHYFASLNDPDNSCGPSRDSFSIPAIGEVLFICEEFTEGFLVYAQYDSPLRIVEIDAIPDDRDPDPASTNVAYTLFVNGGAGSGVYQPGESVEISALLLDDKQFVGWDGDVQFLDDPNQPAATIVMPMRNVYIKALLAPLAEAFRLTVVNGSGTGLYGDGAEVGISAMAPPDMQFEGWTSDPSGVVADPSAPTTFVRVTGDTKVNAQLAPRDDCPDDPSKTLPGVCGCGRPDIDSDADGLFDCVDACPHSNFDSTVVIDSCNSSVPNRILGGGCTIADEIALAAIAAKNHGQFVSLVASLTDLWKRDGVISGAEKGRIQSCAAKAH